MVDLYGIHLDLSTELKKALATGMITKVHVHRSSMRTPPWGIAVEVTFPFSTDDGEPFAVALPYYGYGRGPSFLDLNRLICAAIETSLECCTSPTTHAWRAARILEGYARNY